MKCPRCSTLNNTVLETRRDDSHVWRNRACNTCNHVWPTCETQTKKLPHAIWRKALSTNRIMK
jgi:transcriptional regulator NrdR family protein